MKLIAFALAILAAGASSVSAFMVQPTVSKAPSSCTKMDMSMTETYFSDVLIQGESLRTWDLDPSSKHVHLQMTTSGRPAYSEISLWSGPNYTPANLKVYLEDGNTFPFNVVLKQKGEFDTVRLQNTGPQELPLRARVAREQPGTVSPILAAAESIADQTPSQVVQGGGAVKTFTHYGELVRVLLKAGEGSRNINVRLELLQGPNNIKQSIEYYASNGYKNPLFCEFVTPPDAGYTLRVTNIYPVEFPLNIHVESI